MSWALTNPLISAVFEDAIFTKVVSKEIVGRSELAQGYDTFAIKTVDVIFYAFEIALMFVTRGVIEWVGFFQFKLEGFFWWKTTAHPITEVHSCEVASHDGMSLEDCCQQYEPKCAPHQNVR